ncbi:MAG: tail fiber domain-containing protein [Bacteroidetes bacterium]|nr:tail fiber domain-containing protein [Bacteroidota bacterium]
MLLFVAFLPINSFSQVKVNSTGLTMVGPLWPKNDLLNHANINTSLWVNGYKAQNWGRASWTTICRPYTSAWTVRANYKFLPNGPQPYYARTRDVFYVRGDGMVCSERGFYTYSDSSLKTDISNIDSAIATLKLLQGVSYKYKLDLDTNIFDSITVNNSYDRLGFIAQDVQSILPGIVDVSIDSSDTSTNYAISYSDLIPLLVEGIKEQQDMIDDLESIVADLVSQVENCCETSFAQEPNQNGNDNQTSGNNYAASEFVGGPELAQNHPNPFSQSTTITCHIPNAVGTTAEIMIPDLNGGEIARYPIINIDGNGMGSVVIDGNTLNAGMYNHTLLVNNQIIDTKKMILTK